METKKKEREFAEDIPSAVWGRWVELRQQHPNKTKQRHILEHTGLSHMVIMRALNDKKATPNTLAKMQEFFNQL